MTPAHRIALSLAFITPPAFAGNYATCILDKAPGTPYNAAANAVHQYCIAQYPDGYSAVVHGSGGSWLSASYKSGAECIQKKTVDTPSQRAVIMIGVACRRLYDGQSQ
ncbi:hypothetical protein [Oxalicibacterium faecigallinarum]|uniref:DUF4189 domain-containing protein n=1 Tax=Oxalicibacterium faecigallinarum TaxID=573741 RepID=A0A8J3AQ83_9BURK|nr:hypothetical protein [Oxalicibacterium faecigallinarum]GGI19426.1 hypothetical protein GCM10008066_19020 [Oxalicibacterium faecigallinarum]